MVIVERNFFRLLRCGAFGRKEQVEPMSAHKWGLVYRLALLHDVVPWVYEGLKQCRGQFFLQMTDKQWDTWEKTVAELRKRPHSEAAEDDNFLRADHLTNPLLNRRLQSILDDEQSDMRTRRLLLCIIRTARHILNEGVPVAQLVALGQYLQAESGHTDFTALERWLKSLRMRRVAQLEGRLLVELMGFEREDIPFIGDRPGGSMISGDKMPDDVERVARELITFTNARIQDFYFSQGSDIFVHTSNGSAMLGHVRRSARYFRYLPSETITNFFASFAHSLSHIEE